MNTNQHLTSEEIALYAEALINNKLHLVAEHVRKHVKECNMCAHEVLEVAVICKEVSKENILISNNNKIKSISKTWISVAASISIIIAGGIYLNKIRQNTFNTQNNIAEITDTTNINTQNDKNSLAQNNKLKTVNSQKSTSIQQKKTKVKRTQFAGSTSNYATNKHFENLVLQYSNNTFRGTEIIIKTENTLSTKLGSETILSWENIDEAKLTVELFNNKGDKIKDFETNENSLVLPNNLNAGLYYWKLINEDFDLLFCGKIEIR